MEVTFELVLKKIEFCELREEGIFRWKETVKLECAGRKL